MTRINLIDPSLLLDQHLMAECREIAHIYAYVEKHYTPKKLQSISKTYTLNKGHVMFFMDKLKFILQRHIKLVDELHSRGVNKAFDLESIMARYDALPDVLKNDYSATQSEIDINVERIVARFMEKPMWYRYKGEKLYRDEIEIENPIDFINRWSKCFKGE